MVVSGTIGASHITAGSISADKLVLDDATMTATTIGGVPTLVVNELNANVLTTGVLNADRINVDGATINKSPSGALQIKDLGVDLSLIHI